MKSFTHLAKMLFCFVPVLVFLGCSADSDKYAAPAPHLFTKKGVFPSYESVGRAYDSIYREYRSIYTDSAAVTSLIIQRVEDIADRLGVLEAYQPIDQDITSDIQNTPLDTYLSGVLSPTAQTMFTSFMGSLENKDDSEIYAEALLFESEILTATGLSTDDTGVLFTATSIIKAHTENGGEDWHDHGGTIIKAVMYGSDENSSKAVVVAVVVRLRAEGG